MALTHCCIFTNSTCNRRIVDSYSVFVNFAIDLSISGRNMIGPVSTPVFLRLLALVGALVVISTSCSSSDSATDPADRLAIPVGGAVPILTQEAGETGSEALGTFLLQYDAGLNCLYHQEADNNGEPGTGGRVVIVWPAGYSASSRGDSVTVFNRAGEAVARTGVPFTMAGGGGQTERDHCDASGEWLASGDPQPILDS